MFKPGKLVKVELKWMSSVHNQ